MLNIRGNKCRITCDEHVNIENAILRDLCDRILPLLRESKKDLAFIENAVRIRDAKDSRRIWNLYVQFVNVAFHLVTYKRCQKLVEQVALVGSKSAFKK